MGFAEPERRRRRWCAAGTTAAYRATRSQRAREILTELVPALLAAFGGTRRARRGASSGSTQFLARLPAGVQLFSLFHANPGLLAPGRRDHGARRRASPTSWRSRPALLDAVLSDGFSGAAAAAARRSPPSLAELRRPARATSRRRSTCCGAGPMSGNFQIGVQLLRRTPRRRGGRRRLRRYRRGGARRAAAARRGRVRQQPRPGAGRRGRDPGARPARQPRDDRRPPISTSILIYDAPDGERGVGRARGRWRSRPITRGSASA